MLGRIAEAARTLSPAERRRAGMMLLTIAALHVVGFGVFIAFVVPSHYKGLGIGVAGLAYSLGLRHAFDADHISAIDNTTRKLMSEGKRPLSIGYWFSLGHSTIVVAIGVGIVVAEKAVYGAVSNSNSSLEQFGGIFGTVVSATFLYLIAAAEHRHPERDLPRVPLDARRQLRRGRARAPAQQPRADVPLLRKVDEGDRPGSGRCTRSGWCSAWASTPRPRSRCSRRPRCSPPSTSRSTRSCACRSCSPRACA